MSGGPGVLRAEMDPPVSLLNDDTEVAGEEEGVHTALIDTLLSLVSRAHALCSELLRLSRRVSPLVFTPSFHAKYKDVLFDFEYLKAPEHHEDKIERSLDLLELSDSLKEAVKLCRATITSIRQLA